MTAEVYKEQPSAGSLQEGGERLVSDHARFYWQYEYDVAAKYMFPLLEKWGTTLKGSSVIDVGCGEGGGLCALYDAGAECAGFDIDTHRVHVAKLLHGNRRILLATGNLYDEVLPFRGRQFDLVILHDVFEHLERKKEMLQKLTEYMKPQGRMLITFPPYYSAYGAHQQLLRASFLRLPFFHLLPFSLSRILPMAKGEEPYFVEEVQKLGRLKMGMRQFETIVTRGGMKIEGKQAYIIGPNHIRFGLKPIPANRLILKIPFIAEVVCTGVVYLLSRVRHDEQ
jgi:SAM-dependent methyltransferase